MAFESSGFRCRGSACGWFLHSILIVAPFLLFVGGARAQTADSDLRQAAEKIAAMQREALDWQEKGNGVESLRLREEAKKLWDQTVGRMAEEVDGKRRAEEEMSRIQKDERREGAVQEIEVASDAWAAAKATAGWITQCAEGPEACLIGISKAKTAIEKGFDAAAKQVDVNVHSETASYAGQIRATKERERTDLEKSRDAMDRLSDWIDYSNDAVSHDRVQSPVPIHSEFGGSDALRARGTSVNENDYEEVTNAVAQQGKDAQNANARAEGERDEGPDFADDFGKIKAAEQQKSLNAARDVQSRANAADSIEVNVSHEGTGSQNASDPVRRQSSPRQVGDQKAAPGQNVEHCKGGSFHCPNGFPWKECTHPEKYDCPPPEYAAEARKARSEQQTESKKNTAGKKP